MLAMLWRRKKKYAIKRAKHSFNSNPTNKVITKERITNEDVTHKGKYKAVS